MNKVDKKVEWMKPLIGGEISEIDLRRLVFPTPLGPVTCSIWPPFREKLNSFNKVFLPFSRVTLVTVSINYLCFVEIGV